MKLKANATILTALLEAQAKMVELLDQSPQSSADISNEAKSEISLYVTSWVMPLLGDAIEAMRGDQEAMTHLAALGLTQDKTRELERPFMTSEYNRDKLNK